MVCCGYETPSDIITRLVGRDELPCIPAIRYHFSGWPTIDLSCYDGPDYCNVYNAPTLLSDFDPPKGTMIAVVGIFAPPTVPKPL